MYKKTVRHYGLQHSYDVIPAKHLPLKLNERNPIIVVKANAIKAMMNNEKKVIFENNIKLPEGCINDTSLSLDS